MLPCENSQSVAPPQISGGPKGTSEVTKIITDSSGTAGTPAIAKPIAATSACARAVPSRPYMTPRVVWLTMSVTDSAPSPITLLIMLDVTAISEWPSR